MKLNFSNKFKMVSVKNSGILSEDKIETIYAKNSKSEKSIIHQKPKQLKN